MSIIPFFEITFRNFFTKYTKTKKNFSATDKKIKILAPTLPSKIIAVGLNYKDHAAELKMPEPQEPLLFMKPPSAVIAAGEIIRLPKSSAQVDYEGELAVIIKKKCFKIDERKAKDYILGYTCANDVTARDLQKKDGQWTRAKSFDTFCPLGPCIETELDLNNVIIKTYLNGEIKQDSTTANFIFNVFQITAFISNIMTLLPGDVILTGTPFGVGALKSGDRIKIEITGIGSLENRCV